MTVVLGIDTATAATVVGVLADGREPIELRHDPGPGERPGHARELLALAGEALTQAGVGLADVGRIGVGVGPGTFTGLRIGVATARGLAQGGGAELVAVGTLDALADAARDAAGDRSVLAVLDARRGEAFAAPFRAGRALAAPVALAPERLGELVADGGWLAVGDGAVRYRAALAAPGVEVPADGDPLHAVAGAAICRLAVTGAPIDREALVPHYVRAPDARPRSAPAAAGSAA